MSVSFDAADYEELRKIAAEKRVSLAWVVRDAVAAY
ncbi:MAG: ribbon-helix-helix protein, CopG family, partial [Acidobacteria bacterium]|nr:ribbon-helix-helix protein, CopG family [Acidobacteriota bacterium]